MALTHEQLMVQKVSLLEIAVKDALVLLFMMQPDPVGAAKAYAESGRRMPPRPDADPELDLIRDSIWAPFLDDIVTAVQKAQSR